MRRKNLHVRKRSKYSEKRAAEVVGGKTQPGSGSLPVASMKADVKSDLFLLEDKFTDKKSYTLKEETLRKVMLEAMKNNRKPVFRVCFPEGSYYILTENDFIQYKYLLEKEEDD